MAQTRLFDHYLHTAATAMDLVYPTRGHQRPTVPRQQRGNRLAHRSGRRPQLVGYRAGQPGRRGAQAGRKGWPWHAIRLAQTIAHYLDSGGHYTAALSVHRSALAAALACDDQAAEAASLNNLGIACARLGLPEEITSFQKALAIYLELGDKAGQGRVLGNLGHVYRRLGRHQEALDHYRRHLDMHRALGDLVEQATALTSAGTLHFCLGNYAESLRHYQQSLMICRESGDLEGQARTLKSLADAYLRLGDYAEAIRISNLPCRSIRKPATGNGLPRRWPACRAPRSARRATRSRATCRRRPATSQR